jgi:hypothetical protein
MKSYIFYSFSSFLSTYCESSPFYQNLNINQILNCRNFLDKQTTISFFFFLKVPIAIRITCKPDQTFLLNKKNYKIAMHALSSMIFIIDLYMVFWLTEMVLLLLLLLFLKKIIIIIITIII